MSAFTFGSAYTEFQEKVKGTIAPGKLADLAILDREIFNSDPTEIEKAGVALTVIDGRIVHETR